MKTEIVLTVAESKRLIAKGLVQTDYMQQKLDQGVIVVNSGSTNAYLVEELLGAEIDKRAYMTGRTTPAKSTPKWQVERMSDLVLVNGQPDESLDRFSALEKMGEGDIYIKGANALNYAAQTAGITIGHPTGGTIGGAIGSVIAKKLRLVIPIGLEKEIPMDIVKASELLAEPDARQGAVHSLWPVQGIIFTEIEAFEVLCNVNAIPVAAGGLAGAEGAMRFLLVGSEDEIAQAVALVDEVQGEPAIV